MLKLGDLVNYENTVYKVVYIRESVNCVDLIILNSNKGFGFVPNCLCVKTGFPVWTNIKFGRDLHKNTVNLVYEWVTANLKLIKEAQ